METLGTGLVVMFNGLLEMFKSLGNPLVIFAVVLAGALWWLAVLEVEVLNRTAVKPTVGRH